VARDAACGVDVEEGKVGREELEQWHLPGARSAVSSVGGSDVADSKLVDHSMGLKAGRARFCVISVSAKLEFVATY
jgi:hypothetical protein